MDLSKLNRLELAKQFNSDQITHDQYRTELDRRAPEEWNIVKSGGKIPYAKPKR